MAGAVIIIALAIFAAGVAAGAVVIVSMGIRREERDFSRTGLLSLTGRAPDQASQAGRLATGLYVRHRDDVRSAPAPRQDLLA
ncbi:MAG: hypothetical protein J2P34_09345 [Actinobacteria bacterium]|nr:hypothetical protein [Actinomycetota bacterium]